MSLLPICYLIIVTFKIGILLVSINKWKANTLNNNLVFIGFIVDSFLMIFTILMFRLSFMWRCGDYIGGQCNPVPENLPLFGQLFLIISVALLVQMPSTFLNILTIESLRKKGTSLLNGSSFKRNKNFAILAIQILFLIVLIPFIQVSFL